MKLSEEYKKIISERKKKKNSYSMKTVNGGFSDGVDIKPGANAGVMNIGIDIYGGSEGITHPHRVPPKIQQYQQAYLQARQTGDPMSEDFKVELERYYADLRNTISARFIQLLEQLDQNVSQVVANAVKEANSRYQE